MPGGSKKGGGLTTKKSAYGAPFKMKGNPMQRNFGIGSPAKHPGGGKLHNEIYGEGHDNSEHEQVTQEGIKRSIRNIKRKVKHGAQDVKKGEKQGTTESAWFRKHMKEWHEEHEKAKQEGTLDYQIEDRKEEEKEAREKESKEQKKIKDLRTTKSTKGSDFDAEELGTN